MRETAPELHEGVAHAMLDAYGADTTVEYGKLTLRHAGGPANVWEVYHEGIEDGRMIEVVNLGNFQSLSQVVEFLETRCCAFRAAEELPGGSLYTKEGDDE